MVGSSWRQKLALWRPLLPYGYSYKASCARIKPSFVIFDIRALRRSALSVRVPGCQKLTNDDLTRSSTGCFIAVPNMATVGDKGLKKCRTVVYIAEEHWLVWFEVAVHDAVAVKILQRQHHLSWVHSATPWHYKLQEHAKVACDNIRQLFSSATNIAFISNIINTLKFR